MLEVRGKIKPKWFKAKRLIMILKDMCMSDSQCLGGFLINYMECTE